MTPDPHQQAGALPRLTGPGLVSGLVASVVGDAAGDPRALQRSVLIRPLVPAGAMPVAPAAPLAGGRCRFPAVELAVMGRDRLVCTTADVAAVIAWADAEGGAVAELVNGILDRLSRPRPAWAALPMDRPHVMGIVNVTPDSFSDGGLAFQPAEAVARGIALAEAGASIIDVGGESTRPGADPVDPDTERHRVEPVIRALAQRGLTVSVDTRHAAVMGAAVSAGAAILNDVTALTGDPDSLAVAGRSQAAVVLMHMRGEPRSMQQDPRYGFAPGEVMAYLAARIDAANAAGIGPDRICIDPGIGFGKRPGHNLDLIGWLAAFHGLGCPVLMGASRKRVIADVTDTGPTPQDRLGGSVALAATAVSQGVQVIRAHDVAETVQAVRLTQRLVGS